MISITIWKPIQDEKLSRREQVQLYVFVSYLSFFVQLNFLLRVDFPMKINKATVTGG